MPLEACSVVPGSVVPQAGKGKALKKALLDGSAVALATVPLDIPPSAKAFLAADLPFQVPPIKVANVMATAYFTRTSLPKDEANCAFDLVRLAASFRNAEYMPKVGRNKGFPATILRMAVVESHMTSFAIFEKGVVNLNGALRSAADAFLGVKRISQLLRKLYPDLALLSWSVTNVYANARLPLAVRLDRFASLPYDMRRHQPPLPDDHPLRQVVPALFIEYNPEVFAGAKIWFEPTKGSWSKRARNKGRYATLFVNGHMNLTGNKSVADAWLSYLTIVRILTHTPYLWKHLPLKDTQAKKRKPAAAQQGAPPKKKLPAQIDVPS